jgi:hypothetical protein
MKTIRTDGSDPCCTLNFDRVSRLGLGLFCCMNCEAEFMYFDEANFALAPPARCAFCQLHFVPAESTARLQAAIERSKRG